MRSSQFSITKYNEERKGAVSNYDEDARLVKEALARVADYSNVAAAKRLGVSEATIRRWREGDIAVPLRTSSRLALRRFLERTRRPAVDSEEKEGLDSLLTSPAALYATLSDFGPPGEAAEDKLALIELLSLVAARLRRQGRQIPVDHLTEAHGKIIRGEI